MGNLLTHHVLPLVGVIVGGSLEVRVVHLCGPLRDVNAASDVNRGQPEPAVETVSGVADLGSPGDHPTVSVGLAGDDGGNQRGVPRVPVLRCLREMRLPVDGQVITKF